MTVFGMHRINETSKFPVCVAPSAPTNPARSIANNMGMFCNATS